MSEQPIPASYRTPVLVWLALVALTLINVSIAGLIIGSLSIWVTLGIAIVQAALILVIFMHLKHESLMFNLGILSLIVIVIISIGLTFVDVLYR